MLIGGNHACRQGVVLSAALAILTAGAACAACAAPAPQAGAPQVVVAHIAVPVTAPVWSDRTSALFALANSHTVIARIRPTTTTSARPQWPQRLSPPISGLGRNLVADAAGDDNLYLPLRTAGRVAVVSEASLRPVASLPAGPAPSYLSVDSGSDHLLVLGRDNSTVTPLDLYTGEALSPQRVHAGSTTDVDGAKRGRRIDFYLAGTDGVFHYKWTFGRIRLDGHLPIPVTAAAGDLTKPSRLYVAVQGSDQLLAVDVLPGGHGLEVSAQARLADAIDYVAVDEHRVYAATDRRLYVFASNSFAGFAGGRFTLLATVDFRAALTGGPGRDAPLSGLAVGTNRVYLTLQGVPEIVSIAKPPL